MAEIVLGIVVWGFWLGRRRKSKAFVELHRRRKKINEMEK